MEVGWDMSVVFMNGGVGIIEDTIICVCVA